MNAFKKKLKEATTKVEGMAFEKKKEDPAAASAAAPTNTTTPAATTTNAAEPAAAAPAAAPTTETATAPAPEAGATAAPTSTAAATAAPVAGSSTQQAETFPAAVANPSKAAAEPLASEGEPTHVETLGNGTVVKKFADGRKMTAHPDGKVVNEFADGSSTTTLPDGTTTHFTPTVSKEDPLDKALSFGAKKLGFHLSRDQTEKITDAGRGFFEKKTGKKVSSKISN